MTNDLAQFLALLAGMLSIAGLLFAATSMERWMSTTPVRVREPRDAVEPAHPALAWVDTEPDEGAPAREAVAAGTGPRHARQQPSVWPI